MHPTYAYIAIHIRRCWNNLKRAELRISACETQLLPEDTQEISLEARWSINLGWQSENVVRTGTEVRTRMRGRCYLRVYQEGRGYSLASEDGYIRTHSKHGLVRERKIRFHCVISDNTDLITTITKTPGWLGHLIHPCRPFNLIY